MRQIPKCFVDLIELKLTGQLTRLRFNDFLSEPIPLNNGTTQGDPDLMLLYRFYKAPLIEVANSPNELSPGFVDDLMMLAIGNTLAECHGQVERHDGETSRRLRMVHQTQLPF